MREARSRNRERNEEKKVRSRTLMGQAEARIKLARAKVLRNARERVSNAEIQEFKKLLRNTSGRANYNFTNVPSLNRAWKNFTGTSGYVTQTYYDPYSGTKKYNIPPASNWTYQRIRKHYLKAAQQAALNAHVQALNAERQRVNAYMAQLRAATNVARTAQRRL
jgi:hypothetical protein